MELQVKDGAAVSVSEQIFDRSYNEGLIHQVVVAFMAGARAGTKRQLTRSEVSGGGKKPWNQKGTGRARAGTTRSPIWRTGGVTFAARPRNFEQKVNRKAYRIAMASIFSELIRQDRLVVVDALNVSSPKTREILSLVKSLGIASGRTLMVTEAFNEHLFLGSRNVIELGYLTADTLDPVSLVGSERVVITRAALKMVEEWLS
ncbi:MAG: 50S ribosomal protein L4 [Halothiobacillus sp. 24-54-40]|jgi:large subunit ribosomal protein L4|nr:50S ribosomal protein L4 [Halothiobacillaceae bacterium]OYV46946.1 MAG: 50S ribosomal protein L4 [Halothiobacillus sp. 20-53-49]OYY40346.1 MAG: 50S ribosomal protein L4 [Halothiobacillus sp. 35-54-62]OYZ86990.1 MAG: 50S ribosomal protein L4 [Halothiobacillus sp. 24-54-40]OZA80510.1 MAG: 50S ribosomal protein L4 [Halothiobacillus sp. 39-53-45]HQS02866.1 50S ribosomal protein L4 [Halothiobacillus sp.]